MLVMQCKGARMMAKLYWRVKLNGKWTWRPADVRGDSDKWISIWKHIDVGEEEE
jgi:hypothetical protein